MSPIIKILGNSNTSRKAKKKAKARKLDSGSTTPLAHKVGAKKRSASTYRQSGRALKTPKLASYRIPPPLNGGAKDVSALLNKTPATKRIFSHSGIKEQEYIIYVSEMEIRITAEARGVLRKNILLSIFRSIYLGNFKNAKARPKLNIKSIKKIGTSNWEETLF